MPLDLPQPQFGIIQQLDPHFSTFQYQDGSGIAQVWSYGGITVFVPPAKGITLGGWEPPEAAPKTPPRTNRMAPQNPPEDFPDEGVGEDE